MIKVGVVINNGELKNVSKLDNANANEISLAIANLELNKTVLVQKLIELTQKQVSNTPVEKNISKTTSDPTNKLKNFKKPEHIKNCSDKQYNILRRAGYEDSDVLNFTKEKIRNIIGTFLDNLKEENI